MGIFTIRRLLIFTSEATWQPSDWQVELQPSPLVVLPSSHCSPAAALVWPSPHTGSVQSESQLPVSTPEESQASPGSTLPSPQCAQLSTGVRQVENSEVDPPESVAVADPPRS